MQKYLEDVKKRLKCWWDNHEYKCGESHVNCRECGLHVPGYSMQDAVKDVIGWIYRLESAQPKWISVEERLPEVSALVLVIANGKPKENVELINACLIASFWGDEGWIADVFDGWDKLKVTCWMPLPEAPKEG